MLVFLCVQRARLGLARFGACAKVNAMVIHKIGVLPLARVEGEVVMLIHKPKPKQGDADIAWGLARGTRMYFDIDGGVWVDARERTTAEMYRDRLEDPIHTAWREMQEELDVQKHELEGEALHDMGTLTYDSVQKMAYPIHWFAGWVKNPERPRAPEDAAAVRWVSARELNRMADAGEFKASYVPITEAIIGKMLGRC